MPRRIEVTFRANSEMQSLAAMGLAAIIILSCSRYEHGPPPATAAANPATATIRTPTCDRTPGPRSLPERAEIPWDAAANSGEVAWHCYLIVIRPREPVRPLPIRREAAILRTCPPLN